MPISWCWTFFCFLQTTLHSSSGPICRKAPRPAATRAAWQSRSHLHGTKFLCPSVKVPKRGDDSNARDRKPDRRLLHQENYGVWAGPPTLAVKYEPQDEKGCLSWRPHSFSKINCPSECVETNGGVNYRSEQRDRLRRKPAGQEIAQSTGIAAARIVMSLNIKGAHSSFDFY